MVFGTMAVTSHFANHTRFVAWKYISDKCTKQLSTAVLLKSLSLVITFNTHLQVENVLSVCLSVIYNKSLQTSPSLVNNTNVQNLLVFVIDIQCQNNTLFQRNKTPAANLSAHGGKGDTKTVDTMC